MWLDKAYEILNWSLRLKTPLIKLKEETEKLEISSDDKGFNNWDLQQPTTSKNTTKEEEFVEECDFEDDDIARFEITYLEKIILEASKWKENCLLVKEAVLKLSQRITDAKLHEEKVIT